MRAEQSLALVILTSVSGCTPDAGTTEMPALFETRQTAPLAFENPESCRECHQRHVEEWRISSHAYAQKDPVYLAMVRMGQAATAGKLGQFCVQCHTPTGLAMAQTPVVERADGVFTQSFEALDTVGQQGVSCDVCHSIENVVEPLNARLVMTPNGERRGTIRNPISTPAHASTYSKLHADSRLCGSCHHVQNGAGALIEETFPEWERSQSAAAGKTCQTCHMPEYRGRVVSEGPERTLHRHTFVGVDVSLLPPDEFPGYQEMRDLTTELLQESAEFSYQVSPQSRVLEVRIKNLAGHALPSGATAERQMWIELVVRDSMGRAAFETGTLDAHGDLRDGSASHTLEPGSDPGLIAFGQQLIFDEQLKLLKGNARARRIAELEEDCVAPGLGFLRAGSLARSVAMPWEANWQCNYLIQPDATFTGSYDLSELGSGSFEAHLKLRFRTFPPYFLRLLENEAGLDADVKTRLPIVDMAESSFTLSF